MEKYAQVIVDISHEKVDRPFSYRIPASLEKDLRTGMCVLVPFGKGNKEQKGYVTEISDYTPYPKEKLKEILCIVPHGVSVENRQIQIAAWMKEQYGSTFIQALKTVLPVKQSVKSLEKRKVVLTDRNQAEAALETYQSSPKKYQARIRLLEELLLVEELAMNLVTDKLQVSQAIVKSLEKEGLLMVCSQTYYRNPVKQGNVIESKKILSRNQQHIIDEVIRDYDNGELHTYLIHGITGSGKTEVYIRLIEEVVARGKQAIMLIPEIALTYQTLMRFYARFGERVSVMNSTLSQGEKYDQCMRAKNGEIDVIIGPRSALFTPFPNIGLILIDEEHENSYKSEQTPKYHARETAEEIARMQGASVVLGSATPSMESYYRAKTGKYKMFTLKERLTGGTLPKVYTVDLREELKSGNRSIFSLQLQELMKDRLEKGEQIMLFLNRRGYAGFISCRSCGHVMKCPHCDVSLSEHKNGRLICHYCGYSEGKVIKCPSCGSKYISGFRAGTQQIEEKIKELYPSAKVLRMDADTTRNKESYENILSAFANGEADILIGTQMIVKGHDFPNVTLVGILAADLSLSVNDYRASERTFQLLTQAAGRAGRGSREGEVVIQTYQPEHYSIIHAANQDYESFYEEEILYRRMLRYPPVGNMLAVLVFSKDEQQGMEVAQALCDVAKEYVQRDVPLLERTIVIGPTPAGISKMNDVYRFMFYVKEINYDKLIEIKNKIESKQENVFFDFNPMNTY